MRKFLTALVCIMLVFSGCADTQKSVDVNQFLVTESIALTEEMHGLTTNAEYGKVFTISDEIGKITAKIAAQDYSQPEKIYLIQLPDTLLKDFLQMQGDMTVSDELLQIMRYKWNAMSFAGMINGYAGVETLAASSIVTWEKSYIQPEGWTDNIMLLLDYDSEFSSLVSFTESGDGVIGATAAFIMDEGGDLLVSLSAKLGDIQFDAVEITDEERD